MKRALCLLIVIIFILTPFQSAFADADLSPLEGNYISQVDGTEYVFNDDGTLLCDGEEGSYFVSDNTLTVIVNGYVNKYTYEFLNDLLVLYSPTGVGIAFTKQQEETDPVEEIITTGEMTDPGSETIDFDEIAKSVLLLSCYDQNDDLVAMGSGFIAFDSQTIITNYHVIEGITKVVGVNEYGTEVTITGLTNYDVDRDIAILKADTETGLIPVSIGDSSSVKKGEEIYTIGSPQGLINTVSSGLLSGEIMLDEKVYLQISAPTSSGSSGGVLLNKSGQVIGVTAAELDAGQNLNFAIPINDVVALYNQPENVMTLEACVEKENSSTQTKTVSGLTGTIISRPYPNEPKPCKIQVVTTGEGAYCVFLKRPGKRNICFLIDGEDSFELNVPEGRYYLYYAYGTEWDDHKQEFTKDDNYYQFMRSLQLEDVSNTNEVEDTRPIWEMSLNEYLEQRKREHEEAALNGEKSILVYLEPTPYEGSGFNQISKDEFPI